MFSKGFTLIELLVVISIISILSAVVLFGVTDYINKGKDAAVQGNLVVLVTAGEVWYDSNNNSYAGFCNSKVVENARTSVPSTVCCNESSNAWAAWAQEFTNKSKAFCIDSTGIKKEITTDTDTCAIFTSCSQF